MFGPISAPFHRSGQSTCGTSSQQSWPDHSPTLLGAPYGAGRKPASAALGLTSYRFDQSILRLYAASLPFLVILIAALIVITYFPELSLWLVGQVGGP